MSERQMVKQLRWWS